MLGKRFRLRKKEDFEKVFRSGKPLFEERLGCRYLPSDTPSLRIGFSFGKRYAPLAVTRNRLRRMISNTIASECGPKPLEAFWVVFYLRKSLPGSGKVIPLPEVDRLVRTLLRRLRPKA